MRPAAWSLSVHLSRAVAAGPWERITLADENAAGALPPELVQLQPARSMAMLVCERQSAAGFEEGGRPPDVSARGSYSRIHTYRKYVYIYLVS